MKLARRILSIEPSATLAITAAAKKMAAAGIDMVSFSAGEPDFSPPEPVRRAAVAAVEENHSKYTPAAGIPALRQAIADKLAHENGLAFEAGQVVVTVGAKQAIYNALQVLLDPGDEAVFFSPYWVSYPEQVKAAEGVPVVAATDSAFELDPGALAGAITDRTRVVILNSPSNPTGAVASEQALGEIAAVLRDHPDVTVISDEIYERLVYDGTVHRSIANVASDLAERTILVNGFSKSHAVPGWRVGYAAGPTEIISAMARLQGHSTSNASSIAQYAMLAACEMDPSWFTSIVAEFTRRRDVMVEGLNAIKGFRVMKPQGAFYAFADISGLLPCRGENHKLTGSTDFAKALIEEAHVAVIPGLPFGAENFLRFSYTASEEDILRGIERVSGFVARLTK